MGATKLWKFGGMLPAWESHLIPDGQAVTASNCYLFSGALTGWRQPSLLRTLNNSAAKFAFRLPNVSESLAAAYLVFVSLPQDGDTVSLGEQTYTWRTSVTVNSPAYDVMIGVDTVAAATNIYAAFTFDNGNGTNQGILYGNNTSANPVIATLNQVPGYNNTVLATPTGEAVFLIAPDFGAAFNNITVAESTSNNRTTWLANASSLSYVTTTFQGGTNPTFDSTITSPSAFMEFLDPDTNVVKSQVVEDAFKRFYIASPSVQPLYNTTNRILAGSPAFDLGINPPACAPGVSVAGGGNTGLLGNTQVAAAGGTSPLNSNTVYLIPIVPTGAIQLQDVAWIPGSTDPNVHWAACIYEDTQLGASPTPTSPGALLNVTPFFTGILTGITQTATFTNPSSLSASTPYWIGIMMDVAENAVTANGSGQTSTFANTFANGFPLNAPVTAGGGPVFQMWGDFTTQDIIEARAYTYTWISAYGEESAPAPITLINGWSNGTWTIGLFSPPFDDTGINRNLAVIRLYRTVSSSTGLTTYYQVADISLGSSDPDAINFVNADTGCRPPSTTYTDTILDDQIALNFQLPSQTFFPPPADLQGFVSLPNGVIASWKNNEIWFCEPYFPHAWPPGNVLAVDFPIVGLGVTLGAVVVCTSATTYVVAGATPGQMSLTKCSKPEPCTSRGSIVSLDSGVYYISPNGLIQVPNTAQLANLTQSWIKKEDWDALVPQKNTRAVALATTYFCWGTTNNTDTSVAQTGFNIALDTDDQASFSIWPQPGGHRLGFMSMTSPLGFNIDNLLIDPWSGQAVLIMNQQEYWYDFTSPTPIIQTYNWKSKKYQADARKNYSALRVFCQVPNTTPVQNPVPNTSPAYDPSWNTLGTGQWGIIKVWADPNDGTNSGNMVLVMARELRKNGQIMRLPDGYKAENWQIEVLARVTVTNIQVATSVQELGQV
jgi:hypothetical protein